MQFEDILKRPEFFKRVKNFVVLQILKNFVVLTKLFRSESEVHSKFYLKHKVLNKKSSVKYTIGLLKSLQ